MSQYNLMLTATESSKQIHVIKDVRAVTGWGLKESKEAADQFRDTGEPILLRSYTTSGQAARGLEVLRSSGYANGEVVRVGDEQTFTRTEVILMLADAADAARKHEGLSPSSIIQGILPET